MRVRTLAFIFAIMIILFTSQTAQASHVLYSLDEMVDQSDAIVIGKIAGFSGEYQRDGFYYSLWGVNVDYYLKGNPRSSNIKVITPGTEEAVSSVSYDLGPLNGYNLLFLRKAGKDLYIPMSISGRILLEKTPYNRYIAEKQEMQNFIENSTLRRPITNLLSISAVVLLVAIYVLLIMGSRRKKGMNK